MANKKLKEFIPKLILFSLAAGALVGILELFIGHRFILDPLLYDKDPNFVYETYFAPTFYGLSKSIVVAITFFFTYLLFRKKINLLLKSAIIGVIGTIIFGVYYYFAFPHASSLSSIPIAIVHFSFIAGISYLFAKIVKLK